MQHSSSPDSDYSGLMVQQHGGQGTSSKPSQHPPKRRLSFSSNLLPQGEIITPRSHHTSQLEHLFHAGLEPDSFTYANIGSEGGKLSLPDWGVSLLVPRGALEPGYIEEVHM